ncbi:MAG: tetratricopeptide repeat protein, partial [Planctomycetota bacterium]
EMYEDAVAKDSANTRLRRLLADSLRDAGRIRDAVWVLEEARDDFPDALDVHRALARLYAAEGVKTGRSLSDILAYVEKEYDESIAAYLKDHFMSNDEPIDMAVQAIEIWSARHGKDLGAVARLARLHLARKDAEKGIPVLEALVQSGQSGPWLIRGLAELHALAGDETPAAEEAYARAIASGLASDEVLLALAKIYASNDRKDPLAAEVYHRASGIEGCPPEVKVLLAEVYFDGSSFEDAASLCQEVLRVHPGHARAQMLEARALLKAGHVEGALDRLWEAHRASPGALRPAEDLAEALAAKGEVSGEAVSVYEKYLGLARKGSDKVNLDAGWAVMRVLGLARFRAGKVEKGLSVIKALYSRENSRPMGERLVADVGAEIPDLVALEIGRTLLKLGDFSRARPLLVRGVKPDPSAVTVILEAVREAREAFPQQLGQAIHLCEALREQVGDDAPLLWEVVEGYLAEGDVEEAATRTRKILGAGGGPDPALPEDLWDKIQERWLSVVAKGHRSASAFYLQGRARLAQGEPKDALRWFKQSRTLDAKDRSALEALKRTYQILVAEGKDDDNKEKLADLHMEEGEVDEAIPVLQSLPEDYPRKQEVIAKLARCFIEKGHPLIASKNLERALGEEELDESNAEMYYTLANAYEAAGDLRKAKITYEKIGFWNYTYRDVRERLSDLGKKVAPTPSTPVTPSPLSPVPERKTLDGLETAELPVGKVEGGRFEVLELRGRGGMAVVYKALDHEFDPPLMVALKVLPEEFAHREKAVRLLKREASAAIQLTHPGIVRIFSTGEEQGKRYISMEYIEGPDFATVLDRRGQLP